MVVISLIVASGPTALDGSRATRRKPLLSARNGISNEKRARVWGSAFHMSVSLTRGSACDRPLADDHPRVAAKELPTVGDQPGAIYAIREASNAPYRSEEHTSELQSL